MGSQWKDIYQFLCNASEREVAAFSNGYAADHERAYAALQHWTIRGPEASLAQLISALRQHRRNDVVEKIRGLMEDTTPVTPGWASLQGTPWDVWWHGIWLWFELSLWASGSLSSWSFLGACVEAVQCFWQCLLKSQSKF